MTYLFLKKKFGPGKSTIYRLKVIYTIELLQLLPVKKKIDTPKTQSNA